MKIAKSIRISHHKFIYITSCIHHELDHVRPIDTLFISCPNSLTDDLFEEIGDLFAD